MKRYFSQYGPHFPKALAYLMLQGHLSIRAYLREYWQTKDFIELGAQTPHSKSLRRLEYVVYAMIAPAWIVLAFLLFFVRLPITVWLTMAVMVSLIAPLVLSYGLAVVVYLLRPVLRRSN